VLKRKDLHQYQNQLIKYAVKRERCGFFIGLGLGKTVTSITAMSDMRDDFLVDKILVIAPLRVANTVWEAEIRNWEHLNHLKVVICTGNYKQRAAALSSEADVYVINRENIPWMVEIYINRWRWSGIIVDESTSFKNASSKRFRALRKILPKTDAMILLTGTPAANGAEGLWGQCFFLDAGERLFRTIGQYRGMYFTSAGFGGYSYRLRSGAFKEIQEKISDITISMKPEDYIDMPPLVTTTKYCLLDAKTLTHYSDLENEFVIAIDDDTIDAVSTAALGIKLQQLCNGAVYDENRKVVPVHTRKLDALKEIIEDNAGESFLIAYSFKHDLDRIQAIFPDAVILDKKGTQVDQWNAGKIRLMLLHPASAGHGLNLQGHDKGNNIIWFGLPWSLELYLQLNGRIHRQGKQQPVTVTHLICKDTIEEKVLKALKAKASTQNSLLEFLKAPL